MDGFMTRLHVPLCDTPHRARNVKSASVCEGKRVVGRLKLPRIVELCKRHAPTPAWYLLMARTIPRSQQVLRAVANADPMCSVVVVVVYRQQIQCHHYSGCLKMAPRKPVVT